jgi:hypothetical protein
MIATVSVVAALALGAVADLAVGAAAADRVRCRVVDGVTVRADLAAAPITWGLVTGSIGRAEVHVPWSVVADRLGDGAVRSGVTVEAAGDAVVVARERGGLPVRVAMAPGVTGSGDLTLTPVEVSVAGQRVPSSLVGMVTGDADAIGPRVVPLDGAGVGGGARVVAAAVAEDGLDLSVRLSPTAITSAGGVDEACGG